MFAVETGLGDIGREAARELARQELSRSAYSDDEPLLARLADRALDVLTDLLDRAAGASPGGLGGLFLLLLVVVAIAVAVRLRVGPLARRGAVGSSALIGGTQSATDHRRAADEAAARGDFADAVRERLRAVVRELEDRGVLDPRAGRTAGEVARDGGEAVPALAVPLGQSARVFDEIWYGGRGAVAADDETVRELDTQVRAGVRAPS